MAYPTRGRDPFLDAGTQAFLERRGVEALGLCVSAVGVAFAMALASYAPEDSAWISAGGPEIKNWLGQIGAIVAAPLIKIMGLGSWGITLTFAAWGLRLIAHIGAERMLMRLVYAPIFWALCALYAATLTPISSWSHSFSMCGLFGDTVLFMILQLLPGSVTLGANIVAIVLGTLVLILGGYVTGLIFREIKTFFRVTSLLGSRLILGLIYVLARGWAGMRSRQERRAAERNDPTMDPMSQSETARVASVIRANPAMPNAPVGPALPGQPQPKSLFARVLKRGVEPKPAQSPTAPVLPGPLGEAENSMQDRIRGKIVEAIRARDPQVAMAAQDQTPIVTAKPGRPTGPEPIILQHPAPEAPFM